MLEFNPDGSLKLTAGQIQKQEIEKKSIVITREQISVKPAAAQVRIRFPEAVQNPGEIIKFYDIIDDSQFKSVNHSIQQIDEKTFLIKVDSGSMFMYSLLNFMVNCFRSKLSDDGRNNVIVRGSWANFGNFAGF